MTKYCAHSETNDTKTPMRLYPCENSVTYIMHKEGTAGRKRLFDEKKTYVRTTPSSDYASMVLDHIEQEYDGNRDCYLDDSYFTTYDSRTYSDFFVSSNEILEQEWEYYADFNVGDGLDFDNDDDDYFGDDYNQFSSDSSDDEI